MSSLPLCNTALPKRSSLLKINKESPSPDIPQLVGPLDATKDARRIVRLVQCPCCSNPLKIPVALPCGEAVCRKCLPTETHRREHITYPKHRLEGFKCPVPTCGRDHVLGDCGTDYVLKAITETVRKGISECINTTEASEVVTAIKEQDKWALAGLSSLEKEVRSRVLSGGRLSATYTLAEMGELQYDSEAIYTPMSPTNTRSTDLDTGLLEYMKYAVREELDCFICRNVYLDPHTTSCGHTFCRKCIQSVLENTLMCPACRTTQVLAPTIRSKNPPINLPLARITSCLFPEAMALRADISLLDDDLPQSDFQTPLFVCTLSFPEMPTFLHIFEPRYRLMIDRALQTDSKFGMLLHNPQREPQGHLGPVHFYQYGTLLHIANVQRLPDGRSLLETRGVSKFRVLKWGSKDGYTVGDIERIDDMSIAEEESLEIREMTSTPIQRSFSAQAVFNAPPYHLITSQTPQTDKAGTVAADRAEIAVTSTQALFEICFAFVKKMEAESAPWLHSRVYAVYGPPPEDPATFPWWFGTVLPLSEFEKYR
jgi:Lon protease-like protein